MTAPRRALITGERPPTELAMVEHRSKYTRNKLPTRSQQKA